MEKYPAEVISTESVACKIHAIRGLRVMIDSDLAFLYQVETKALNQAVKRNLARFPGDFMFRLSEDELKELNRSQSVTGSRRHRNQSSSPYAFTEQGVAMLSTVLRSDRAIQVSILIMRVFSRLRGLIHDNQILKEKIDELEDKYDGQFREVFNAIDNLSNDAEGGGPIGFQLKAD